MRVWVAMDIGCMESDEPSECLGVFRDQDDAAFAAERARRLYEPMTTDSIPSHSFPVFPVFIVDAAWSEEDEKRNCE